MRLVVNGDDLGYTKANTLGIVEAYRSGILRSTTALANSDYLAFAANCVQGCEGLGVGVHLTLTLGAPLTDGATLATAAGQFPSRRELDAAALDMDEVRTEWRAQIERFCKVFGRMPTHIDSHHSVHDLTDDLLAVSRGLAKEYGLELRRYGSFEFVHGFFGPTATSEALIELLRGHEGHDIEIMTHPGYCDLELYRRSSYNVDRVRELAALCDASVLAYVDERGIELSHY